MPKDTFLQAPRRNRSNHVALVLAGAAKQAVADLGPVDVAEIEELLRATSGESGTTVSRHEDSFGFSWVVIDDPDVDDLATTAHVVCQSLEERGFGEQLLCAVFGFDGEPGRVDLVYAYKRGSFYPFAPREGRTRDGILERRVQAVLTHEIALEPELERWYPVWDAPVAPG